MQVILSAHFDLAHQVPSMKLDNGKLAGLVDNFAGVFAAYQANRRTDVPVYLTNFEENGFGGAIDVAKKLDKDSTVVIVVDTVKKSDLPAGTVASVANVYNVDIQDLKKKFGGKVFFFEKLFEPTEDETWIYGHRFGFAAFYFGIPIPKDYHETENNVSLKTIDAATDALVDIVNYLRRSRSLYKESV